MILTSALLALLSPGAQAAPPQSPAEVSLTRKFTLGEKLAYSVRGHISSESREIGLNTFIPEDLDLNYDFTAHTVQLKADGIADVMYVRPTITQIDGETFDSPAKTFVEKLNQRVLITLSPINEILKTVDQEVPKKKKPGTLNLFTPGARRSLQDPFGQFIGEVQRLGIFFGSVDSSLDFNPKFDLNEVKVGDSWKRTVGFSPQKLKGKKDQAVQRLDYTYVYKGEMTSNGKRVRRIEATLKLETDLAEFYHQLTETKPADSGLAKFPLTFSGQVQFDVDPKTGRTLLAQATSTGGFSLFTTDDTVDAKMEQRFKGRTKMTLTSATIVPVKK